MVYSRQTLEGLAELLRRKSTQFGHPIYLIADEPYRELVYDGVEVPFLPTIYPNTLVCYSYSKSLSLPGERIGYVCVPSCVEGQADVLHAVAGAARSSGHVCPPTLVQLALQRCADARPDLAAYDANRRLLYRELTQMGYECIPPQGAFYLFVRVPDGDDVAFSQRAKLEHDLLVVPQHRLPLPRLPAAELLRLPRHDPAQSSRLPGHTGEVPIRHETPSASEKGIKKIRSSLSADRSSFKKQKNPGNKRKVYPYDRKLRRRRAFCESSDGAILRLLVCSAYPFSPHL